MLKKDFWYDLPKELIAQEPADPRDSARLMVLHRNSDAIEHHIFHDLPEYLQAGDVLVVNNSKVLPARLRGLRHTGGKVEFLLLSPLPTVLARAEQVEGKPGCLQAVAEGLDRILADAGFELRQPGCSACLKCLSAAPRCFRW